jgi:hypothetical protein
VDKTMANRNLLKEAIADAKSVKEAAIANAKAALEEAFTPYLKEKFSAKLAEMEAEDMDEAKEEMDENYSEEGMEEMSNPVMRRGLKGDDKEEKRTEKMREESEVEEMDLDELLAELDEEMGKDEDMEENLNEDARTDAEEEGYEDGMEDEKEDEEEDEIDLEDMTEDELKDLIEDVIEDMVRAGELEAGEKFEDDEEEEDIDIDMEDEEEMVSERKHYGGNKGDKPRKSTAKEKDELLKEEEEVDEVMVSGLITMVSALVGIMLFLGKAVNADQAEEKAKELLAKVKAGETLTDEEQALIDKATALKKPGVFDKIASGLKGLANTMGTNRATKTGNFEEGTHDEKKDMMREIEELASTLSETKLLNAKLLYTNKIFRAKNIN